MDPRDIAIQDVKRLLVVMPNWVGDVVMATPTLRALRKLLPQTHITALLRSSVRGVLQGCPWVDKIITSRPARKGVLVDGRTDNPLVLSRRLAARKFDAAVLLTNSFRSALVVRMAGIPKRIGYDRDGRGMLLTDRLIPVRTKGKLIPVSTLDYYLGVAQYMGAMKPDPTMQLFASSRDKAQADKILNAAGYAKDDPRPLVILNPGANYGDAKIWEAGRFAQVATKLVNDFGAAVAVTGSPKERAILDQVIKNAKAPVIDLSKLGVDLGSLKAIIQRAKLLITNDTGPRHYALALGVPVVVVYGPTNPAWTDIHTSLETKVLVPVECGPCQKKKCPLTGTAKELQCMRKVTAEMVLEAGRPVMLSVQRTGQT
jgi:heptosyltransferase-2